MSQRTLFQLISLRVSRQYMNTHFLNERESNRMRLKKVRGRRKRPTKVACILIQTNQLGSAKMPPDRQEREFKMKNINRDTTKSFATAWTGAAFLCLAIAASIAHETKAAVRHAAAVDEPTSLPAHQQHLQLMLNGQQKQQIFQHQESELGNSNQATMGDNQQRSQPLSLRALPVSSRGTLAFVPRGGHRPAATDPLSPIQFPSHILSTNSDWCAQTGGGSRSPTQTQVRNFISQQHQVRSTTEVLAVEGASVKLNLAITGHRAMSHQRTTSQNGAGAPAHPAAHQMRLRLHWQRDNQLICDLNLARGRFSSIQLASENEPEVLRRMLVAQSELPQQASGSGVPNERVYNATRAWHSGARQKISTKNQNKGKKDYHLEAQDDDLDYHLEQSLLFYKLLQLQNKKNKNNLGLNNLNLLATSSQQLQEEEEEENKKETSDEHQSQNQDQDEGQDQTTNKYNTGFALYPSINVHHLETFQRQATGTITGSSSTSLGSGGDQISHAARQAIGTTLKRLANLDRKHQQTNIGSPATTTATTNTNSNVNNNKRRLWDNFLADGQAIDWPTLGLYLQAHNALSLMSSEYGDKNGLNNGEKNDNNEDEDKLEGHHLCQQPLTQPPTGELEQLIIIQFEISQLRLQDRGQYQLHVCQQSVVGGGPTAGHANSCLQSQLVAVISLQVIEDVPRLESWFEPQLLNPGDRFSIKCEATGYTLPQISWYLDGQLLSEHHLQQTGVGGGRLSSPGDDDSPTGQGDDQLSSSSGRSGGTTYSKLPSRSRSVISSSSSNQFFRIGDYVSQDNHVHSFVNSSALRLADGGHYKCQANNGLHLVEHEARIDLRGPASIERPLPYNASALQGANSRWTVQCPYSGYPIASIEWYFRADSTKLAHQHHTASSPVAEQQQALADYAMETGGGRSAREAPQASAARRKRRHQAEANIGGEQQESVDEQEPDRQEYLVSVDDPGDAPDPDKDEWLSQASAMTMSPNGEDYPEPLPDYPVPVTQDQDQSVDSNQDRKSSSHLLARPRAPILQTASLLDNDEFELSTETEDSQSSRLAPDYGDIDMNYQQLSRKRRSPQVMSSSPWQAGEDWVKLPQSRRHQVHPNGTLSIHDIQQADQGHYKCHVLAPGARHDPNSASGSSISQQLVESMQAASATTWSNELYLSVLVPPSISPFSSSESLREGMRNFLTCSVIEGDSPVRLSWLKDGAPIEEHIAATSQPHNTNHSQQLVLPKRIKVETNNEFTSTLSFSHVDFRDNGNYTCIATNKAASVNYTAKMVVNVPPKWTKNPKDLESVAGQSIVIDCQAEGHPSPRIWWEIGVSSAAAAAPSHRPGESKQEELLSGKQVALALTGASGGSVALNNPAMGGGHEQPPNHYRTIISNSRIHILENASLVIRDVGRQDQGYYLCQAANNFGSLSALIKLTVNVGASFSSKYLMKYVKLNERIELDCDPSGQAPVTVTWFVRQQQPLPSSHVQPTSGANQLNATSKPMFAPTTAMAPGNNQSLSNYHHHHQAEAAVVGDQLQEQQQQLASSASGHRRRLFTGTIQTELPVGQQLTAGGNNLSPHHLVIDDEQQQRQQGLVSPLFNSNGQQKLIEIDSTMSFEILKLRNLSPQAMTNSNAEIVRLHIKQARRSHSGEYICQAANQFGGDEKLIRLLVQEPPDPVSDIKNNLIESRSVSITWNVPFTGNSPITSYTVEWAPIGGGETAQVNQQQQQQQQTSGANLQQQQNGDQRGRWSQMVVQQPSATLGPLQPTTNYEIRVRAHNQFGSSPMSAHGHQQTLTPTFVVTTNEEAPGAPPSDVQAHALSSSSVQVDWLPPSLTSSMGNGPPLLPEQTGKQMSHSRHLSHPAASYMGKIEGYLLGYRIWGSNLTYTFRAVSAHSSTEDFAIPTQHPLAANRHDLNHSMQQVDSGKTGLRRMRAIVSDLNRNTKYQIIVQASNSGGFGPQSDPIEVRTLLNDPPPAPLLRLGLATYTSLELQWSFNQFESQVSSELQPTSGGDHHHHPLEPLENIKQLARFSPLVFSSPQANREANLELNNSPMATNKEQPLVDGYHLYFRRAPTSTESSTPPLPHEWHERRLTQETHSIVQNPTASGNDLSIVEHGTKFATGETKPAGGWLRFHGPNSTLAHKLFRHTLDQLTCGTQYQIYLVAYNSYGAGLPSQILRAKTRGSPPLAPRRQQDFVQVNSTLVQLALGAWADGGCSLANFEVRYKQLRGGRPEAIEMLREGPPVTSSQQSQLNELVSDANGNWRLLSQNISPEQRSIELRDLRPETWYGIWVTAESAAGKSDALYAFMTLDKLGQVPSDALEPLPISGETNLPALFKSGTGGAGGAIRSILYNLSGGGGGGPNGTNSVVSPLILSACMVLIIFATCSLFLIRRYNNLVKDNHSIDMSSSRTTTTSTGGAGTCKSLDRNHHHHHHPNHYNNGLDLDYSLDTKLNSHNCELDHHQHLHTPQQHYQQPNGSGGGGDTGSIISSPSNRGGDQQHHYSMKLSPCKTGGATIITNSSSSTNGSSGAFLLGGGGGGDSSTCEYGSTHHGHHHDSPMDHQHQPAPLQTDHLGQFMAQANCRLSRLIDQQQQQQQVQFCAQPNCVREQQLGKFATLAHQNNHLTAGSPVVQVSQQQQQQLAPPNQQRHSTSFRTLPHSSLRPVSTFLPPNALQNASGCAMTNGAVESLNRFYGASGGEQHQDLADQQQICSKLRLLQQYQAATASSAYNLNAICQQQQQQLQEAVAENNVMALSQIYASRINNAPNETQHGLIEATVQQSNLTANNDPSGQQLSSPAQQAQQPASAGAATAAPGEHQETNYALPFPPKWV